MIRYDLPVCIGRGHNGEAPQIKCKDTGVQLAIHLTVCRKVSEYREVSELYDIPDGCKAVVRVHKPDGTAITTDNGLTVEGKNVVVFSFADVPQASTAVGVCNTEIVLYDMDDKRLTTATFTYEITAECVCGEEQPSADYFDVLGEEIKRVKDAAETANEAAGKALGCSANPPRISQSMTWETWDPEAACYVDSGVLAEGTDYILTNADKQEIAAEAAAQASGMKYYVCGADEVDADGKPAIAEPDSQMFYLVPSGEESPNLFLAWAWINSKWERFEGGAPDLVNYVKNTDYATNTKGGIVQVSPGHGTGIGYLSGTNILRIVQASEVEIMRRSAYTAITPLNLDRAIKEGVTTNTIPLTEEEQTAAQAWLGVNGMKKLFPKVGETVVEVQLADLDTGVYFSDYDINLIYAYVASSGRKLSISIPAGEAITVTADFNDTGTIGYKICMRIYKQTSNHVSYHQYISQRTDNRNVGECFSITPNQILTQYQNQNIYSVKNFTQPPIMTGQLSEDDDSTSIPNTAWIWQAIATATAKLLPSIQAGNDYGCTNDADGELLEVSGAAKVWHLKPNSLYVFYSVQWNGSDPENTGLGLYSSVVTNPNPDTGIYEWNKEASKTQGSKMYIIFTGERKSYNNDKFGYLVLYQSNKTEEYRMLKGYGQDTTGQLAVVSMGGTAATKCADVVALNL